MMTLSRRSFLGTAALLGAAALLPRRAAAGAPTTRVLGRTGLKVSEVGMGVMITSDPAMVRAALDAGVTYFDTARAYMAGRNEELLGEGLAGRRREVVVATKCHVFGSRAGVIDTAEASLRALKTDVIDVFQYHGFSQAHQVLLDEHLEAVRLLKQSGKIRFAGLSTHGNMVEVMDAAVKAGAYDTVLTVLNFQSPPEVIQAVERAAAAGLGVVAMKVMAGGYTMNPYADFSPFQSALRWVLQRKGVSVAIPSMVTLEQVKADAAVMGSTLTWRDRAPLTLYAAAVSDRLCRMCGSCEGCCPHGLDIPRAQRGLMYAKGYGQPALAAETLAGLDIPCGGCPACSVSCRFGLPIRERMLAAARINTPG